MEKRFAVIGGDLRQRYAAAYLRRIGCDVETYAVPGLPDTSAGLKETLRHAKYVLLPMPAVGGDGHIRNSQGATLRPEELAEHLRGDATVFGGKLGAAEEVIGRRAAAVDYAAWETLAIGNAVLTAEGAIGLAIERSDAALHGSRCLVIGAGRIGMRLARMLQALGADVTVTARKDADLARIRAERMGADVTGIYGLGLGQYRFLFNTVPAPVLTEEQLERVRQDCVLIELASAPGGFSREVCRMLDRRYVGGGGLPGLVSPETAGELIAAEIAEYLRRTE